MIAGLARFIVLFVASGAFVGYIPYRIVPFSKYKGSGLLGSLLGWAFLWWVPSSGPAFWVPFFLLMAVSVAAGHWAEKWLTPDDPRIVIDEVAGVWVAAAALPRTPAVLVAALVLFRVFDVWKGPWGRRLSRWPGGWGISADDWAAGLIANGLIRIGLIFL